MQNLIACALIITALISFSSIVEEGYLNDTVSVDSNLLTSDIDTNLYVTDFDVQVIEHIQIDSVSDSIVQVALNEYYARRQSASITNLRPRGFDLVAYKEQLHNKLTGNNNSTETSVTKLHYNDNVDSLRVAIFKQLQTKSNSNCNLWIQPGKRRYNRIHSKYVYSNDPHDNGNYNSKRQLVGTMRSISASAWESYTGKTPSASDMKAISVQQAIEFYKHSIWDKVQADKIQCQILAEMLCDMKSSAGYNGVKQLQAVLGIPTTGVVDSMMLDVLNSSDYFIVYEEYRRRMIAFYKSLNQPRFLNGWLKDMNRYYPQL